MRRGQLDYENHIPIAALNVLQSKGGDAARSLHEKRKAAFKDLFWWEPFRRGAMNEMGFQLLEAGRIADA